SDGLAGDDPAEPVRRRRVVVLPHARPHRWVFGPKPPNRVSGDAVGIPALDFVIGGDAVEEPDVVAVAVVFDEGEMRIGGLRIEDDIGPRIPGRKKGLLQRQLLGWVPFYPILAINPDGNHGAIGGGFLRALVQGGLETILP